MYPTHERKGYASEAAARVVRYFEIFKGQKVFLGYCDENNEAIQAVFKRLGWKSRVQEAVWSTWARR
jgi:RimJ/RimL family protein N-acetyltransferase